MRSHDSGTVATRHSAISNDDFARFNYVAIFFHWTIAGLILANILIGWQFSAVHGPLRQAVLQLHKSIGISVLLLSMLRVLWRRLSTLPPFPTTMRAWEKIGAKFVERWLYFVMFAMPLTGWAIVSSSGSRIPTMLFGIVHWPDIPVLGTLPPETQLAAYSVFVGAHHFVAKMIYVLVGFHVLGALRHQFIKRDLVLARMIPILARRRATADLRHL
jgi:cytochrome b561